MRFSLLWLISIKSMACFIWRAVARMLRNKTINQPTLRPPSLP
jgi:hypothetical protein